MALGVFSIDQEGKAKLLHELGEEASIGTSKNADIQVDDIRCGGIHAIIERIKGTDDFVIIDLGSRSGTFVDGKRISETRISSGNNIHIGIQTLSINKVAGQEKTTAPLRTKGQDQRRFKPQPEIKAASDAAQRTVLQVALFWGEQILDIRTFEPGSDITLGPQKDATFGVTMLNTDESAGPYQIAHFSRDNLKLHIPQDAAGLVWVGNETISLDSLRHEDKQSKQVTDINVPLKVGDRADIHFGELTLSFRFVTPAEEPPKRMFFHLDRTFLRVMGGLILLYIAFFLWLFLGDSSVPQVITVANLPKHMQRVIFDVGIEKALKRQQAAIGQIAKQLEGGRARGEEGQATTKKTPLRTENPDKKRNNNDITASKDATNAETQEQDQEVDISSAFSQSSSKSSVKNPSRVTGGAQDGNTAAAFTNNSGLAQGRFGFGAGGGGTSVGIGALQGNQVGGGLGSGDYGLDPAKGREINIPVDEELQILGGLDPEIIAKYIKGYLNQIRNCYEERLQVRTTLKGKVKVSFIIKGDGGVKSVRVIESSLADPPTHQCIINKINNWKFPKPQGGGTVGVKYPFLLMSNTGN